MQCRCWFVTILMCSLVNNAFKQSNPCSKIYQKNKQLRFEISPPFFSITLLKSTGIVRRKGEVTSISFNYFTADPLIYEIISIEFIFWKKYGNKNVGSIKNTPLFLINKYCLTYDALDNQTHTVWGSILLKLSLLTQIIPTVIFPQLFHRFLADY